MSKYLIGIFVFSGSITGIYYIAIIPTQRKKGFGTAMVEHLLQAAQEKGYFHASLHASEEEKNLYKWLVGKECGIFEEYAWE